MENFQERRAQLSVEVFEPVTANPHTGREYGDNVSSREIVGGSKNKDLSKKGRLILAVAAFVFSITSSIIIIMTTKNRARYLYYREQLRYLLAIDIISTVYTSFQVARQIHQLTTGRSLFDERTTGLINFFGDQIIAYLLMSAASSAVPLVYGQGTFGSSSASISISFLAFVSLGLSALILVTTSCLLNYIYGD